ncbi:flippase-like domain-containing protein [Conexibacter woesei]|uniref:Phosphatidylinositol alpha-mannosyltransferase n=1 Tax=Conexibacter woesei (strain DSM 14684 / CCUG 47730 / CIP 108061 / JCM 11494 / NBRC 100937 / ID131577) TaxID=469383 RepID=D3F065_CONWI|nr:flippase-like domain-containing protein [Conexibacter woesei]ADB50041.1 Phosphatidylinositol alpha-mannosyltransferase [Conexibacter woesei DSM 14684]
MRIALVSPYSWTYPGGVTRHIEALAESFLTDGHDVRVLAPFDPDDRRTRLLHRGAAPQRREVPDYLIPLGGTIGLRANGAVSNLMATPNGVSRMRHELRNGGYDVVHLHEPIVPRLGWDACVSANAPLVGTFHAYSTNRITNNMANVMGARRMLNHLHVRVAVSEAAAWTAQRFFGGRYRIIPNGVAVPDLGTPKEPSDRLRVAFVGQAVERKGLPILLRAFEALREHIPVELTIVGANREEVEPLLLDDRGITVLGRVDDDEKRRVLERADVLCAPSLGGESFGMVLTEAFAAGTPVVASDIAGYRDVVRDGTDGVLVPRGDATALAETLRDLWLEPRRRAAMGVAAAAHAQRFAWPRVSAEVIDAYQDAIETPSPRTTAERIGVRVGTVPADLKPKVRAQRLASIEPPPVAGTRRPAIALLRRVVMALLALAVVAGSVLAFRRIGVDRVVNALLDSSPAWVLVGLGIMCASMAVRAVAWRAILEAALPNGRVRLRDAMQGTFIGVLMSATLPARLGEPSRALIVARRTGRPREHFPIVLGTIVSQTLLNIVALVLLGIVTFSSVSIFSGHQDALLFATIAPLVLLAIVLIAPPLLSAGRHTRFTKLQELTGQARRALGRVRDGLMVFRNPRLGATALFAQLGAWVLQWISCYVLLVAFGLDDKADLTAAAAVLFAVNVTAVLPATPSNLGIFQAACVVVLHKGYGVSQADALGYGIVLQAVEIATAVLMGMPALLKEGLSWKDVRLRAMQTSPVKLRAHPRQRHAGGAAQSEA